MGGMERVNSDIYRTGLFYTGRTSVSCDVEVEEEVEITCTSGLLSWDTIRYSVNDYPPTEIG